MASSGAQGAAGPGDRPLRLSLRGRRLVAAVVTSLAVAATVGALTLVVPVVAGLFDGTVTASTASADATPGAAPAGAPGAVDGTSAVARTVVVQPGETLWQLAERAAPAEDSWTTVREIRELNTLPGGVPQAGQRLVLPGPDRG